MKRFTCQIFSYAKQNHVVTRNIFPATFMNSKRNYNSQNEKNVSANIPTDQAEIKENTGFEQNVRMEEQTRQRSRFYTHPIMRKLDPEERLEIESMIRVDHAGEYGAVRICQGQLSVLKDDPVVKEILEQEEEHLQKFNEMIAERRVRPTIMMPIWHVVGYALGKATALMGRETAMACHAAVEDAISEHYTDQLRRVHELPNASKDEDLRKHIKKFRDEELHHHQLGLDNDAEKAPFYNIIYKGIKFGCSVAIALSKKI